MIEQKKLLNKAVFEFGEEKLTHSIKRGSGTRKFSVHYAAIPLQDIYEVTERNSWYRSAGIFWIVLGCLQMFYGFQSDGGVKISFWFLLGIVFIGVYLIATTSYTIFQPEAGNIFIIKDRQHDTIIDELKRRRKQQVLARYGEIDYSNSHQEELNKFQWLFDQEILSEEEFSAIKQKILLVGKTSRQLDNGENMLIQ